MENTSQKPDKHIFIFDAKPGMVISRDIFATDGKLIAAVGTKLTFDIISRISNYQILEIYVYEREAVKKPKKAWAVVEKPKNNSTYFDKIRESEDFKEFSVNYNENLDNLKEQLNDIVNNNGDLKLDSFMESCDSILSGNKNSLQMFDMLHSIRQHDDSTFAHSVNVAIVASIIGQWLKYSKEDIEALTIAGLLHDIGKLTIAPELLNKPDKLTPDEFEILKKHVTNGYEYIKNSDLDERIKDACLLHHEKCDGSGYPRGLKGDEIPPFAKIIAVADIYDAMTAKRSYRGAICPFDVVHLMQQEAFTTLDPNYTLPFLKNVASSYINTNVKLSNGKVGEVILINDRDLSRPVVKCDNEFIDLSKTHDLTITALL